MNKYEITIITKEDAKDAPVKKEIEGLGGKVLEINSLGQRQMIFPIKKETAGYYTVVLFEIDPTKVLELNKKLGLSPAILRHIILVAKAAKVAVPKEKVKESKILAKPIEIEKPKEIVKKEEEKEKPAEKPKIAKEKPAKKIEKVEAPAEKPKVSPAAKAIEAEEMSADERLKALDKKLDELLKE